MFVNLWILNSYFGWFNCALGCLFIVIWVPLHFLGSCLFRYKRRKTQKHSFRALVERSTLFLDPSTKIPWTSVDRSTEGRRPVDGEQFCSFALFLSLFVIIACFHLLYLCSLLQLWYLIIGYCVVKVYEPCFNLSHTHTTSKRKDFKWEHKRNA